MPEETAPRKILTLQSLAKIARAPKILHFDWGGENVAMQVRALTPMEFAEFERLDPVKAVKPPRKDVKVDPKVPPVVKKGGKTEDEYDYDDPSYLKELEDARRMQDAYVIDRGLLDGNGECPGIPGETLEGKANWLFGKEGLNESLISVLRNQILRLSAGRIEVANFTSAGD